MSLLRSGVDTWALYTIVRRLARPFKDWNAYKLGVIDEDGNFLIPKKERTPEQYRSMTYLDIFIRNIKRALQKVPGLNSRLVTYSAALWLLREERYIKFDLLTEEGTPIPANTSSGGGLARSSEGEAKAFNSKEVSKKLLKRKRSLSNM